MPFTIESRVLRLEEKTAAMEERVRGRIETVDERLRQLNRSMDRVVPHGEAITEVRGIVNGVLDDIREVREDIAGLSKTVEQNEERRGKADDQRREDRRADRKLLWGIFGGLGAATIAGISGIIAAGIHP
jgi:division protein CdvB (Snf7/Vps24/ESCRT-III family)